MLDNILNKKNTYDTHVNPKGERGTIYRNRAARHRNHWWQKQNNHRRKTRKQQQQPTQRNNSHTPGGWKEYLEETKTKYEITGTTNGEEVNKTNPKGKILETFKTRIEKEGETKSEVKYLLEGNQGWTPGQPKRYMLQLGRTQASTIFKARTRMLQVKNNYKKAYKNLTCRACQKENETQVHVLTACPVIHNNPNNKIDKCELFSEKTEDLKLTYQKLTTIMRKLELCSSWNKSVERPGTSGYTHVVVVVDSRLWSHLW